MNASHSWTPAGVAAEMSPLRERCLSLGLPTWRCDKAGMILEHPLERGPTGLWLRAGPVSAMVRAAVRRWIDEPEPKCERVFEGAWVLPLISWRRRERTGYTVALALGPAALGSEQFLSACGAAQLDAAATRKAMQPLARFDETAAHRVAEMLEFASSDLAKIEEHNQTVSGFTRQLTDCFETIDLLYALGRLMTDLTQPEHFVQRLTTRLHSTMSFGWIATWIAPDDRLPSSMSGRLLSAGRTTLTAEEVEEALPRVMEQNTRGLHGREGVEARAAIVSSLRGGDASRSGDGPQMLIQPVSRNGKVAGVLIAGDKRGDDPQVSSYDIHLLEAAAGYLGAFLENAALCSDQQRTFLGTLEALSASIDAKDRYTCGHSERVAQLAWQLATAIGVPAEQANRIRIAGLVHDVGKIGVPEAVLTKQGRLTDEEFESIKKHPEIGHRILKDIPLMADVLPGVLHHHERWDGKGYPHGLSGDGIPLMARIIALADTFDAMSSTRSYRAAMSRDKVLAEIVRCGGAQFDPALVKPFVGLDFAKYDEMSQRSAGEARQAA